MWLYIIIFLASCALLVRAGAWVVKALIRITRYLRMTEFMVAFVLMSFATTLPELFVGILSAINGQPQLSFGNVIGSNIINLTLAVAVAVLVANGLKCDGAVLGKSAIYTLIIASLPIILLLDGTISRIDGIILLLTLAVYMQQLLYHREKFTKVFNHAFDSDWQRFKHFLKSFFVFFAALALLLISAEGVVWSAMRLAETLNLPLMIIGTIIVALGTNLPEITFGIRAITMGHKDMVLGNLLGAVVSNSTLVLGITVLIHPLKVPSLGPYAVGIIFIIAAILFFAIFSRTGREITRREAFLLLLIYLSFIAAEIFINIKPR